jgi:prepilin-type N-terminal cleavage/methylation domain-containing protein
MRRWKADQGCTLAEVLVSMSILSIVLTGSFGMFALVEKSTAAAAKSLAMTALVESNIEVLRTIPYQSLIAPDLDGDGKADLVFEEKDAGLFLGQQTIQHVLLNYTLILDHPELVRSRAATIKVTADWKDPEGRPRTVRFGLRRANPVFSGGSL